MNIELIGIAGGLFAILAFNHFVIDFIFQSHSEAMQKHNNSLVRAKHCMIYTIGFLPLLYMLMPYISLCEYIAIINILVWSHFCEDTYIPVFHWAKYIRKPPEMDNKPEAGFVQFVTTPVGKILMIAIDQIIHLAFLFPIVYFILN